MTTVSAIDGRPSITFIADLIEAEARARCVASALNISRLGVNLYQRSLGQDQRCSVRWCSARVKGGGAELSKVEASWFTPAAASVLAWNLAASDFQERLGRGKRVISNNGEWTVVDVHAKTSAVEDAAEGPTDTAVQATTELRTSDEDTPSNDKPEQSGVSPESRRESVTSVGETTKKSATATKLSSVNVSISENVLAAALETITDVRTAGLPDVVPPPAAYEAPRKPRDLQLFRSGL